MQEKSPPEQIKEPYSNLDMVTSQPPADKVHPCLIMSTRVRGSIEIDK